MSTQIDWQGELDRAIEHVPGPPAAAYVASGRHAVRRRRRRQSVAGLATASLVGVLAWVVVPGGQTADGSADRESRVASRGASPSPADPRPTDRPTGRPVRTYRVPASVVAGEVRLEPGVVVHERRRNVFPGKTTESVALDLTHAGERSWLVLEWDDEGGLTSFGLPHEEGGTFDDFVADTVDEGGLFRPSEAEQHEYMMNGLADWTLNGLKVRDGVEVVRRVDDPLAVEPPASSVGVVLRYRGITTWAAGTAYPGGRQAAVTDAADSGWLTFEQWLADEAARSAGEPGVQLAIRRDDGSLEPHEPGVEVLDEVVDPVLSAYEHAAPSPGTTVGMLAWDGGTWFVVVTRDGAQEQTTTFAAEKADGASSIDAFIDFVRRRVAEGRGIR